MECGPESSSQLVVAGGETAKLLELVEEAFDAIASAIEFPVKGRFGGACGQRRDDGIDPVAGQAFADAVGIVAPIEDGRLQHIVRGEAFVKVFKLAAVVRLAGREVQGDGAIFIQGGGMDLGA
ncbi:hypothetical protein BH20VER1_BH20VER1_22660 [soil metagenome]